jgi:hypothetical protein
MYVSHRLYRWHRQSTERHRLGIVVDGRRVAAGSEVLVVGMQQARRAVVYAKRRVRLVIEIEMRIGPMPSGH